MKANLPNHYFLKLGRRRALTRGQGPFFPTLTRGSRGEKKEFCRAKPRLRPASIVKITNYSTNSMKAQVSLIIVIGLVAVLVIGLVGIVAFDLRAPLSSSSKSAKQFIQMCFTTTAECTLHRLGSNSGSLEFTEQIPDIADTKINGASYFDTALKSCFDDFTQLKNQGQDVVGSTTSDVVLTEERVRVSAANNLAIKEGAMTTTVGGHEEKFDIQFADMYREALEIKHDAKPDGVPESYVKLDSAYDVSVASKNSKKFVSIAGGELRKQYFRFNFVK